MSAAARPPVRRVRLRAAAVLAAAVLGGSVGAGPAQAEEVAPPATVVQIDVGGAGDTTFLPDTYGTGGITDTKPAEARTFPNFGRTVTHPIPDAVWHTSRHLESSYTIPGLTPGNYELRLYFVDWYFRGSGQRIFDVDVNGTRVLADFDINGTAIDAGADGPQSFGVERDVPVTVDGTGTVRIDFVRGAANQPQINAIVLVPR